LKNGLACVIIYKQIKQFWLQEKNEYG
jgi:hypothetical protein